MTWRARLSRLFGAGFVHTTTTPAARGYRRLVVILDGTLSTLEPGCETNAGLAAKLLREESESDVSVYYEAGLQWRDWRDTLSVMTGDGINGQIRRAYGWLASQYRPGDRIYLIGYSRGAYAVRSLAGIIGRIGLLRREAATERHLREVYRLYCEPTRVAAAHAFADRHCHEDTQIECVAVWDTVKALGLRLPLFWMISTRMHHFHDHALGNHVRAGFHALALNETRRAYTPVLWETRPGWRGTLEQVWFRGNHGDVGGQLGGRHWARPLSNIPFVWLMEKVERAGIALPAGWQDRFPQDVTVRSIGPWSGWGKFFLNRWPRRVGRDPSEAIHPTAAAAAGTWGRGAGLRQLPGQAPAE
ncbi:MAG: DUF2235 domain-containing protein [Pseudomonadota bacterium]